MSHTKAKKTSIEVRGIAPLLQVFDMPTSIHFYCNVLGFKIISTSSPGTIFGWALLRLNEVELMLNTAYDDDQRPEDPDPLRISVHSDTGIYFGCQDVDAVYMLLCENNIEVKAPEIAYYGMKQLYVTDPDGYVLCFQWPATQESFDNWKAWYGS